jgi:hypothetical protein
MWKYNGRHIKEGKAWTDDNGIQHPANWYVWTEQEKEAAGLTWITLDTPPDSRLYNWNQNSDGTITSTAKAIEDVNEVDADGNALLDADGNQVVTLGVKSNLIQQVKTQQASLLSQSDWAVVRKVDTTTAIPANIQTWRDAIRSKATAMEEEINTAVDTDAIAELFMTYTLEESGSTIKSGILFDWPTPMCLFGQIRGKIDLVRKL